MHQIDRRIGLLFGAFLALLAIASLRAAYLGIFRSGALSSFATSQAVQNKVIPAVRGMVTDRNGQVLALSESADEVIADPYLIVNPQATARTLAPLLGMSVPKVVAGLTQAHTGYVTLAYDVPSANATQIMGMHINGISDKPVEQRVYPLGSTAAQVLGWVNASGSGAAGIEYVLNRRLAGRAGVTRIVEDGNQQAIGVDQTRPMQPGTKVALTLSVPLQQEVEKVLASTVATYGGTAATAVVTNPQSGQILADANWPFVNANDIGATPLANTADQSVNLSYEPGSTFKAITLAGGLMDHTITPDTVINEPSCLQVPYTTTCIADAESHGDVSYTVAKILALSSNIGADLIAQRDTSPQDGLFPGSVRLNYWMHRFGFGRPTGVALNGESAGVLPALRNYSGATMYNLPFGQGQEVTPMQMIQFYGAIADGGVLRTPQIILAENGRPVREPAGTRVMSPQVAAELRVMLRGVLGDGGTASGAQIPGYDMAGKTGTSQAVVHGQYSSSLYNASFIGMVPVRHPKLLVYVLDMNVSNGYGGTVAGQAFQKIVGWAVPHFGINPCPSPCPSSAYAPTTASIP
ncbi:MAG TPA: penicillin-binding protein 2 [Solirubrobacteraceae bacterium]|nr:penicillin-binding protein 2 [Solirubrobacteraceae bacterium]